MSVPDKILAAPSELQITASSFQGQTSTISAMIDTLNTSTSGLISTLSAVPLGNFTGNLETLYGLIGISMNCFTSALHDFHTNLNLAAQGFISTDVQMANTFKILDQSLQTYTGLESATMALPASHTSASTSPVHHSTPWYDKVGSWISHHAGEIAVGGGIAIGAGTLIVLTGGAGAVALPALAF